MKFLDETAARTEIARLTASSGRRDFAVAFWGLGAMERLGLDARPNGASVICNLASGATNPLEIRALLNAGVSVRQADDLHAKVYLFDEAVVIGSSNASSNGLSFQEGDGLGWREANVLVEDPALVESTAAWLGALGSREITETDLQAAMDAWSRARRRARPRSSQKTILQVLKSQPAYFTDRGAWLLLYMEEMEPHAKAALGEIQRAESPDIDAYQGFPGLPAEGATLNFWVGERGAITFDGFWERTPQLADRLIDNGPLQLCLRLQDVVGLGYDPAEKAEWRQIIARVRRSPHWNEEHHCAAVSLEALAPYLGAEQPTAAGGTSVQFDEAMWGLYRRILAETPYKPADLNGMLRASKGLLVAKKLLAGSISTGFRRLHELGRPDLTVEALVLEDQWSGLFVDEELRRARLRLRSAQRRGP